jgi:hypothetical protein
MSAPGQVRTDGLGLQVDSSPELVTRVGRIGPKLDPVVLASQVPAGRPPPRVDVVLAHEADDVGHLDRHVAAVVAHPRDSRDPIPRALGLWADEIVVIDEEAQAVDGSLNERWPLPHVSSMALSTLTPCLQRLCGWRPCLG